MRQEDLKIEVLDDPRFSKGGQHVGMPSLGVKITHVPTGIIAQCQIERSQHRNKNVAQAMIEYGLAELGWIDAPAERRIV